MWSPIKESTKWKYNNNGGIDVSVAIGIGGGGYLDLDNIITGQTLRIFFVAGGVTTPGFKAKAGKETVEGLLKLIGISGSSRFLPGFGKMYTTAFNDPTEPSGLYTGFGGTEGPGLFYCVGLDGSYGAGVSASCLVWQWHGFGGGPIVALCPIFGMSIATPSLSASVKGAFVIGSHYLP